MMPLPRNPMPSPRVLVVEDDHRVLELLEIAFQAQGFQVSTASDGDEAYRRALAERPDLVVMDVRLPRRSGLEVCEALRREAAGAVLPIVLVSAAGETDARVQGLASGADDFLPKPFSPRELLARARRLLARTAESREAQRRLHELERELERARDEARRSHVETRREHRLRELAFGLGRELQGLLDEEVLAHRLLDAVQTRLAVGTVVLLTPGPGGVLGPAAIRGDTPERAAGLAFGAAGALVQRVVALGRPVPRRALHRLSDADEELAPLVAGGFVLVAPVAGPGGLEGLLVTDERTDGLEPQPQDLEVLAGLCDLAGVALGNARRHRAALERAVEVLAGADSAGPWARAAALAERAARALLLWPALRRRIAAAVALGGRDDDPGVRAGLERLEAGDASGWVAALRGLVDAARRPGADDAGDPERARAARLAAFARRAAAALEGGHAPDAAVTVAMASLEDVLDPDTRAALEAAAREAHDGHGRAA
jgi:DNA-binding response OmpR family regulator